MRLRADGTTSERIRNFAFTVEDIDAAKRAVETAGGTITHGPIFSTI